jgi:hypothetical protein
MHRTAFHPLSEKNFHEIVELIGHIFWFNFLFLKVTCIQQKTKTINPEVQKLYLKTHPIKGELILLEANLNSSSYIKGSINERCVKNKVNPNKVNKLWLLKRAFV